MAMTASSRTIMTRPIRNRRGDVRRRPWLERFEERCLLSTGTAQPNASVAPVTASDTTLAPTQTDLVGGIDLPISQGSSYAVDAYVSPTSGGGTPTGDVVFTVDGVAQPPTPLQTSQGATFADFPLSSLPVGVHTIGATYEGDSTFASSTAAAPVVHQVAAVNETNIAPRVPAPVQIVQSPFDHDFYITEGGRSKIAQIDPTTGKVTESPAIPTADALPLGIAAASDGTIYFTEFNGNKIGSYNPGTGTFTEYTIPTDNSGPWGIAVAANGDVYFTEFLAGNIGVLNPKTGAITDSSFPLQSVGGDPAGIVAGPSGDPNLYFVNSQYNIVGSITSTVDANGNLTSFGTNEVDIPLLGPTSPDPNALGITIGPDGKVWFTEANAAAIGRWDQTVDDPSGITNYALPNSIGTPLGITAGLGNTLDFTDFSGNQIGVFDATSHTFSALPVTAPLAGLFGITTDSTDGSIWFTEAIANQYGHIATTVAPTLTTATPAVAAQPGLTETPLPNATGGPFGITVGPDNAIWFTESASSTIDRYDLGTKTVTNRIATLTPNSRPLGITTGPGNALYYTEGSGKIGVYDPANPGAATELSIPTPNSGPLAIAYAPAANAVFFTESTANKIGEYNATTGQVTDYAIPTNLSLPTGITLGPDGNMWFTEANSGKIGEFDPANPAVIHEYSLPQGRDVNPTQIAAGPGNTLFFTTSGNFMGKFSPSDPSQIALIPLTSSSLGGNYGLARGPDGSFYFAGLFTPRMGIYNDTLAGLRETTLSIPSFLPGVFDIASGPDGNLYFTEYLAGDLGQVQLAAIPTGVTTTTTLAPGTPNPSNYGQTVTFTATIEAASYTAGQISGDVTFTVDGVDQSPPVPLVGLGEITGYTATYTTSALKPGTHTVTAHYDGDANYAPSLRSNAVTQTVNPVATTTTIEPGTPNPSIVGQVVTFHVTMLPQAFTGNQPSGNFELFVDGNPVKSFPLTGTGSGYFGTVTYAFHMLGAHQVTAEYLGDTDYAMSPPSSIVAQTVNPKVATATIIQPGTPNPSFEGKAVTFHVTMVTQTIASAKPSGHFELYVNGAPVKSFPLIDPVGTYSGTVSYIFPTAGVYQVTAAYLGDSLYAGSPRSSAVTQTVRGQSPFPTTVSLNVTPGTVAVGQLVSFTALVNPNYSSLSPTGVDIPPVHGSVVFAIDGRDLAPVAVKQVSGVGDVATLSFHTHLTVGTHQVVARYTGDTNYAPSPDSAAKPLMVVAPPVGVPTVTGVTRYGYHMIPTELVIGFSTALDPARAQDAGNYSLQVAGSSRTIPIAAARYNATTHQVTLLPAKLLPLKFTYVLVVNGTPPLGLTSNSGVYLSGVGTSHPGTSYVTRISRSNLSMLPAPPLPSPIAVASTNVIQGPASLFRVKKV